MDPDTFHETIEKVKTELTDTKIKKQKAEKEKNFLLQYFLQTYLYSGNEDILKKAGNILENSSWDQWHCAILIESDNSFFDNVSDEIDEELMQGLHRNFFYLNLNTRQSILFFSDVYCDYQLVAKHLYDLLKQNYSGSFHLAVSSRFEGHEALPGIMSQLEQTMEEKLYHPDVHIFNNETDEIHPVNAETQDSQLMQKISEDISRKDVEQLKKHFECLVKKYENDTRFSAMYVKFVFSNVIQELFQENQFSEERKLDHEIEKLYNCTDLKQILAITEDNIREYEEFLERSMSGSRDEVASIKNYIYQHYAEDLSLETLAEKVYLSSGYLSFIFKKETGMNLNRFIRVVRMEKAKELLCSSNMKVAQVSEQVGIPNVSYFCRSFREYYGSSPESSGKEPVKRMRIPAAIKKKFKNMKYRHKLTILLVTASLVPMILLVWYSHDRMRSLLQEKEMEDMSSILEQTGEGIDSQIEVFSSLLNYLTYSPDIEDLITEKNLDSYYAYRKYTEVADPLLSVPKSYIMMQFCRSSFLQTVLRCATSILLCRYLR